MKPNTLKTDKTYTLNAVSESALRSGMNRKKKSIAGTSKEIGHGRSYISTCFWRNRIPGKELNALLKHLGMTAKNGRTDVLNNVSVA